MNSLKKRSGGKRLKHRTTLLAWDDLPSFMKVEEVRPYWEILNKRRTSLRIKRVFDVAAAAILLVFLAIPMLVISAAIKLDSKGPVLFRQMRVTAYGRKFRIHKFRTMIDGADKKGADITVENDVRVTKVGKILRKYRFDEFPQLLDILSGNMSFVGTRPEVAKYVKLYKPEYRATFLMPAGITSEAAIRYRNESNLLKKSSAAGMNEDDVYVNQIMPAKMAFNLDSVRNFRFTKEILTMVRTVLVMCGKEYE